jgi:carboxypeptidase family protein
MVQVLGSNAAAVATAFTDIYGHYRIAGLAPGEYRVRATAITYLPATLWKLRLATGMRATVNLTMNMLADPAIWLPAERRLPGEPGDDWNWTLRSGSDRPILRVLGDDAATGDDAQNGEHRSRPYVVRMTAATYGGDAGFGHGGVHDVIALDRIAASGSDIVLQADLATHPSGFASPVGEVSAGYRKKGPFGNASAVVLTYASHPEMQTANGSGMQWLRMASAETMHIGDLAEIEAGSTVYAIHACGYAVSTKPFLRVTLHPGQVWAIRYRLATSRDLRDSLDAQDIDFAEGALAGGPAPVAAFSNGRLTTESGTHQEIAVTRQAGVGSVRVAVYHDAVTTPAISGTGAESLEPGDASAVVDTATGGFRMLGPGYSASGIDLAIAEPIGPNLWGSLEYASGAGLGGASQDGRSLAAADAALHSVSASTATATLQGGISGTRTKVRASYRWQPHDVVTAVNAYGAAADQAYLSFFVRQAISLGGMLPQGLEATVDVTNLLAEGYHPFLSADGRTLYLAQAPRTIRAGLAFSF